jgi:glycerate 2-kinase
MKSNKPIYHLKQIFHAALDGADPYKIITDKVAVENEILAMNFNESEFRIDLSDFDEIFVFGAGKATARMAKAMEDIMGRRICGGLVSLKTGHTEELKFIDMIFSGHPLPDENSIDAAKKMMKIAGKFSERTLVINLISGGGSALLEYPAESEDRNIVLTLEDLRQTANTLLDCGASINEFNCIRKHISVIKGGGFAGIIYPATSINLILSDVVGDDLDIISSGLTVPDKTSFKDASDIIRKYELTEKLPARVIEFIRNETDRGILDRKSEEAFSKANNFIIGTNFHSLKAAAIKAEELGYDTIIITSSLTGEAKEAAKFLAGIAFDAARKGIPVKPPACIITGGETTVTIRGKGKGGRNQETALSYLVELSKNTESNKTVHFLSASTDGNDGPTDAAGAFASCDLLEAAKKIDLDAVRHLKDNDSYNFFEKIGGLLKTGPTNTNVCDIQIQIIT